MALVAVGMGGCKKRLKLVDVDDDKKAAASAAPSTPPPPPIAQNDPPPAPPADPPPAATEEPPPIIPANAKIPVTPPKSITTAPKPAPAASSAKTATASGKTYPPTCSGTCEKALRCMSAYSEVEHASCVVECSSHPVNREKLAELNAKDCATLVAMLKKK